LKITKLKDSTTLVSVHSQTNRDLGIFLIFTALVTAMPLYYIVLWFHGYSVKSIRELLPAINFSLPIIVVGIMLIYLSRKRFHVTKDHVTITDGLFRGSITFRWKESPSIKVTSVEELRKGKPAIIWQLYLASGRYKYLIDHRSEQLVIRGVAEAIAKTLKCPITEKTESGADIELAPEDLDLPYSARVKKYPHLLPTDVPCHGGCSIVRREESGTLTFTWGFWHLKTFLEGLVVCGFFFVLSLVPLKPGSLSLFEFSHQNHDFFFYYALGIIVLLATFWLMGYKASVKMTSDRATFLQSFLGVPFSVQSIPTAVLEEVRASWSMRGPALQLISDEKILDLRIARMEDAMWLSQEIKKQLLRRAG